MIEEVEEVILEIEISRKGSRQAFFGLNLKTKRLKEISFSKEKF